MRSPSCREPSLAARPVSVMCFIKIWLPNLSPYSAKRIQINERKQNMLETQIRRCSSLNINVTLKLFFTICGFLFDQSGFDRFVWSSAFWKPLIARGHQSWRVVSIAITVRCRAAGFGTVAICIPGITAVGEAACSSGVVLIQQVGLGHCPFWFCGCWDLYFSRTFHSLQK